MLLREGRLLIAQHAKLLAALAGNDAAGLGPLRVGVPLELPADLLPRAITELSTACPGTRVEVSHDSTAAQLAALAAGRLEVALVRERPPDPRFDAVLAVEEPLGVILAAARAVNLAGATGIRLHQLADLDWVGFPREEAPLWYDQVSTTLRAHGISLDGQPPPGDHPLIAEVKFAAVGTGRAFALAPAGWAHPLPDGITWQPLAGNPIVRRTWAVWPASARRRDLAALIAALDLTTR